MKVKELSALRSSMAKILIQSGFSIEQLQNAFSVSKSRCYQWLEGHLPSKKTREERESAIINGAVTTCQSKPTEFNASTKARMDKVKALYDKDFSVEEIITKTGLPHEIVLKIIENTL